MYIYNHSKAVHVEYRVKHSSQPVFTLRRVFAKNQSSGFTLIKS